MAGGPSSLALFTDLYELTMAQAFWQSGMTAPATFSLYLRSYPENRAYFVFAGLHDCLDYLEELRFSQQDLDYLHSLDLFDEGFLAYLGGLRFSGSVRAMPEATIFFANEPVMEVTAPVIEAQIVETYLLNQVNVQTLLATKASRVLHAARGRALVDFSARRAHGLDAADKVAKVSYMVGFAGTSNCAAGQRYGIPTFGTMAHSFVTSFADEIDSFRAYAASFPESATLLVDSYDTIEGTKLAIQVGLEMKRQGHDLRALRLDSGDLAALSLRARAMLDEAGLGDVQLFASGGLDEFDIDALLRSGAPIDGFGVGTKLGVSADAPWTDCAYKLVEYDRRPVLKLSPAKESLPGPKQCFRQRDGNGAMARDVIACAHEAAPPGAEPLLGTVMEGGRRLTPDPALSELRARFDREFAALPQRHKALAAPALYEVATSAELQRLQRSLAQRLGG
ncbi:MAG: nicotinate phosphoribosyltransferase [Dehalococcoidia bacterium]